MKKSGQWRVRGFLLESIYESHFMSHNDWWVISKYFWFYTFIRLVNNHMCRTHSLSLFQFVYQCLYLNLKFKRCFLSSTNFGYDSLAPPSRKSITCSSRTPYFFTKSAVSAANARASAETELNGISNFCCFRRADSNLFESRWTL